MALWINKNIEKNNRFASWNAGQLGYFTHHQVTNLDGLVNNKWYLDNVLSGKKGILYYLKEANIKYIVDYRDYTDDKFLDRAKAIKTFDVRNVRGEGRISIWDIDSIGYEKDAGFYKSRK